jgi:hypothetical protein
MRRKAVINIIFAIYLLVTGAFVIASIKGWNYRDFIGLEPRPVHQDNTARTFTKIEVANFMHEMANGLIIPHDGKIWGVKEMNQDNINTALYMAENSRQSEEKESLIEIARNWGKSDFSSIVDDHNFVWDMLGGTVGRAEKPDYDAIDKAKKRLKN